MLDVSMKTSMNPVQQQLSQSITSYFLLVTVVALVTRVWLSTKTQKKEKPNIGLGVNPLPGPRGIPIFGNMLSLNSSALHLSFMKLARKFGNIFKIQLGCRPVLVLNGYDAIHKALVKQSLVFAGRPKLFTFNLINSVSPNNTSLSFTSYNDGWKVHRKIAETSLRHFTAGSQTKFVESVVTTEANELAQHIKLLNDGENLDGSPAISQDFRNIMRLAVSNIMCWFLFSKRHSYDDEELLHLLAISDRFSTATGSGNPVDFMPWMRTLLAKSTSAFTDQVKEFRSFITTRTNNHQEEYTPGSERDILDHLVTSGQRYGKSELEKVGVNESILLGTSIDYFGAGFETVSSTLEWSFLYMAAHPEVQTAIHNELDAVVGRDRPPTLDDRANLPFVQSCILEILRHATVVPFSIPHSTLEDTVLDGFFVPKDTVVFVNLYSVHYDPDIWKEPDVFQPRRFLAPDGSLDQNKKKQVVAFSLGRRRCVGSDLARLELYLFFSIILQQFSIESSKDGPISFESNFGLTRRARRFDIRLVPRPSFRQ